MTKYPIVTVLLFTTLTTYGQDKNTQAIMKFQDAEAAFESQDYYAAITALVEAQELLGSVNPKLLYLRILAWKEYIGQSGFNNTTASVIFYLLQDCKYYLDSYSANANEKYREVYKISEQFAAYKSLLTDVPACESNDKKACFQVGELLRKNGNADDAIQYYEKSDNADALVYVGDHYSKANSHSKSGMDIEKARNAYMRSCELKNGLGCKRAGDSFFNLVWSQTQDVLQFDKAMEWYEKGAALGHGESTVMVADVLLCRAWYDPLRYKPEEQKVLSMYQQAADAGVPAGLAKLGDLYYTGFLLEKSLEKAKKYSEMAVKSKSCLAASTLYMLDSEAYSKMLNKISEYSAEGSNCSGVESLYHGALLYYEKREDHEGKYRYALAALVENKPNDAYFNNAARTKAMRNLEELAATGHQSSAEYLYKYYSAMTDKESRKKAKQYAAILEIK